MSLKYCLPLSLETGSTNHLGRLIAALYLLPLAPIYLVAETTIFLSISLVCIALLGYELKTHAALAQYSGVHVTQDEQWHLVNADGGLEKIIYKSAMNIGTDWFVLFTHNGRRRRLWLTGKHQNPRQLHKMKVYLRNR